MKQKPKTERPLFTKTAVLRKKEIAIIVPSYKYKIYCDNIKLLNLQRRKCKSHKSWVIEI